MKKHGKKYLEAIKKIAKNKYYNLEEAVTLLPQVSTTKFDSSLEIHIKLTVDPKQADQQIRNTVVLPHGTGKTVKIIAFVSDDKVKEALENGAIKAGGAELIEEVQKGFLDFDKAIATPDIMKDLAKIAKILGPKGLMPSPKAGTVSKDVAKTLGEMMKGRIEYRNDKQGILHNSIAKISFSKEKLLGNIKEYLKAVKASKPTSLKGTFIESITLAPTMGPGIKLDVNTVMKEV
ncbi:MAG: 50S ribosomal protein L1, large subunit ribosomal protein L1 [Candidatus Peregrinibacteria bacterium GW2011_GWF2_33_10]|nr:MAG: 50S ribosomal protein L1, large subunit ribosomal protein L1 [Candidatus Peregrinibacteria bacterium GW2011_GWF2_33_10]OGJ44407.1 MAG: 50S ribosomal protein L1 [Candidatus Peregrinibacteria bacterium RIFOXYA12_FULL_33_12]OGJ45858.1 MAG: 50S ribosomal protein L1 [Candidatus Peregrinibacteria bacterium RIFOXYA2_FULL_33_21]OGJ51350.1 MAG: 50S ribosomal protein L1 [Candidatus Peregrinibacteria bacterium RIFOXYB2_FULL_33_20]